jgi:hypothetical protein
MTTNGMKVWVFVLKDVVVSKGHFDQWCAFALTETEAKIRIEVRHGINAGDLKLVEVLSDRRRTPRRNGDRRLL